MHSVTSKLGLHYLPKHQFTFPDQEVEEPPIIYGIESNNYCSTF